MYHLLTLFCYIFAITAIPAKNNELIHRIIGGDTIEIEKAPYHVGLLVFNPNDTLEDWGYYCGGSIISRSYVLTAGHCIESYDLYGVVSGVNFWKNASTIHKVVDVTVHEKYELTDNDTAMHDIAILKVIPPFDLDSEREKFIELAGKDDEVHAGDLAYVTGWGDTEYSVLDDLRGVTLIIKDLEECTKDYSKLNTNMTEYNICAEAPGKDSCYGDSGGALVVKGKQVGIVSWGGPECADPGHPGIYTDVAKYREWIDEHTKDDREDVDHTTKYGKHANYTEDYLESDNKVVYSRF